jgi:hypothetical protein
MPQAVPVDRTTAEPWVWPRFAQRAHEKTPPGYPGGVGDLLNLKLARGQLGD